MLNWLKRLISALVSRKKQSEIQPYYPTEHADTRGNLPLDPKNDPWGRT